MAPGVTRTCSWSSTGGQGIRNLWVLGSLEPTPREPLRREGPQGVVWSNHLDWIQNCVVQGEPVQKVLRSTYILSRTPCHRVRLRLIYGAAMRALSGSEHSTITVSTGLVVPTKPPVSRRVRGWWSPQNHRTEHFGSPRACRLGRDRWSTRKLGPSGR